jgi:hypothetical protein
MNLRGARKAALALAAMHPQDRRWMLAQLPAGWRSMLSPMIREAKHHATQDQELLQAMLADEPANLLREIPPPDVLIVVLDRLSPVWAARVIAGGAPDHAEIYLASCEEARANSIRYELQRMPNPMPAGLVDALGCYLEEAAANRVEQGALR